MLTILAAVFVFGVLVTVHEFGHFITAKLTGMRVDEFVYQNSVPKIGVELDQKEVKPVMKTL